MESKTKAVHLLISAVLNDMRYDLLEDINRDHLYDEYTRDIFKGIYGTVSAGKDLTRDNVKTYLMSGTEGKEKEHGKYLCLLIDSVCERNEPSGHDILQRVEYEYKKDVIEKLLILAKSAKLSAHVLT